MLRFHSSTIFFQGEDGIRGLTVTGVQTCALPILLHAGFTPINNPNQGTNWPAHTGDTAEEEDWAGMGANALRYGGAYVATYISSSRLRGRERIKDRKSVV